MDIICTGEIEGIGQKLKKTRSDAHNPHKIAKIILDTPPKLLETFGSLPHHLRFVMQTVQENTSANNHLKKYFSKNAILVVSNVNFFKGLFSEN